MKLRSTRRHWNWFARTDPLWAVLAEPDKSAGRWQIDAFFATGRAAIEAELKWVNEYVPNLRRRSALDFGCGVGRLSQALAEHFECVDGVDIAEAMLALAARYNRHGDRVRLVHNKRADLARFASDHYDFVYSDITLQHMAPRYAARYIEEFVRIVAPGGVISFQIPAYVPPKVYEKFKFSWWPPTLWTRLCRFTRRWWERVSPPEPVMEVYAIPRDEVRALLEKAGARLLAIEANDAAGAHVESYRYLATKG